MTPLLKLPKNVRYLAKFIVAQGFEKLPKVQWIAKSGHTGSAPFCEQRWRIGSSRDTIRRRRITWNWISNIFCNWFDICICLKKMLKEICQKKVWTTFRILDNCKKVLKKLWTGCGTDQSLPILEDLGLIPVVGSF